MRLATFEQAGTPRIGSVLHDRVLDLQGAHAAHSGADSPYLADMLALMDGGDAALDLARALAVRDGPTHALAEVRLLAPVPVPRAMRDFMVFETHVRQSMAAVNRITGHGPRTPEEIEVPAIVRAQPIYYKGNRFTVVGPDHDVRWPSYSEKLDFELEFGIFLGRGGRDIPASRARDHVFGYTIFNDVSARDVQAHEMAGWLGPAKGKDFDTGNVIGPWIVTPDELPDPYALTMSVRVNGEVWSSGTTGTMLHSFEDMIAHASRDETLHVGEFLGSGTVGSGCGLELDRWIQPGDVIELEVEGIGTLRNRVVRPGA
ncbi:fumarylacetoacetate hydrolase family protein [Roseomonas sp. CCTCC AB2023176]|uniref:fumarylacetoacetate hydrolase family protein n=1 Tax=Roseomonas sp. CCTCC AB2023176 TaxID=3342640 RepID=UPI0035E27661